MMPYSKCISFYRKLEELIDSLMAIEEEGAIIAAARGE